jgi:hypothetical protein
MFIQPFASFLTAYPQEPTGLKKVTAQDMLSRCLVLLQFSV